MAYNEFAYFYDEFNGEADYDALYEQIRQELNAHDIRDGILADLGCGTGELTLMLTQAGYDMIGIDQSEEMLCVVRDKAEQLGLSGKLLLLHRRFGAQGIHLPRRFLQGCQLFSLAVCLFGQKSDLIFCSRQFIVRKRKLFFLFAQRDGFAFQRRVRLLQGVVLRLQRRQLPLHRCNLLTVCRIQRVDILQNIRLAKAAKRRFEKSVIRHTVHRPF